MMVPSHKILILIVTLHKRTDNGQEEAAEARERMTSDPANFIDQAQVANSPHPIHVITETAIHREVVAVWQGCNAQLRSIYDLGAVQNNEDWDNWIIRWCLWHVFRYRDQRNRRARAPTRSELEASGSQHIALSTSPAPALTALSVFFDPIHNDWRPLQGRY